MTCEGLVPFHWGRFQPPSPERQGGSQTGETGNNWMWDWSQIRHWHDMLSGRVKRMLSNWPQKDTSTMIQRFIKLCRVPVMLPGASDIMVLHRWSSRNTLQTCCRRRRAGNQELSRLSNKLQNPALITPVPHSVWIQPNTAHSVSDLICFYLAELTCWGKCGQKDPECRAKRGADRGVRGLSAAALCLFAWL